MEYSLDEVMETVRMTLYHNFDIRTVTLGINLKDCIDPDIESFKSNVYDKVTEYGKRLVNEAGKIEDKYGVPIINKRISVTPVSLIVESCKEDAPIEIAKTLDMASRDANIDFIGGYGALVQKGMTRSDSRLIDSLPEMLSSTERVCAFLNVASTLSGMNMDAIIKLGNILKDIASRNDIRYNRR
jgi:uncharacterized protein (UPF0210 family)